MGHPSKDYAMSYLNLVSFIGIFGLCFIAWLFSEHKRVIPVRVIVAGILLQLVLGACIFLIPITRSLLQGFSNLLDSVFAAAEVGARFVFGPQLVPKVYGTDPPLGYIFAFRALPTVVFFAGFMALLENLGIIQWITNIFAKAFYSTMRLSGAEALSGAANIFVGIEAAIVVKPYLPKMTRSELCAILSCCFGTAASSTLAIYVSFLRPVFPNILGHLVSASIIAIPACFVISKILVPETEVPLTAGGIPQEKKSDKLKKKNNYFEEYDDLEEEEKVPTETVGGEPIKRVSPLDAAIVGALEGVKMAVSIAAVLILILGLVSLVNQTFAGLASLKNSDSLFLQNVGNIFSIVTLQNILGVLFYPLTILTGVPFNESWTASVIIGRRLLETAIPPYQALAQARLDNLISDRTVLIVSYALSGFAHIASVGIFVGGTIALIPSRRKDISELGWKALFVGTLATMMIACVAGVFYNGSAGILGKDSQTTITAPTPSPTVSPSPSATTSPTVSPSPSAVIPKTPPTAAVDNPANNAKPASVPEREKAQEQEENQLVLDKARLWITAIQVSQYNKAIAQASQIKPNQPLYQQAQQDIERWSRVILDTAEGRAKQGNFQAAIDAAKMIPPEHQPTYEAAQRLIAQWQKHDSEQAANQRLLQEAQGWLKQGQASSYNQAIAIARGVPLGQPKYYEAKQLIGEWSQTILEIAKERASSGQLNAAIQTAALVPENTPAYRAAQEAIALWQRQLGK